MSRTLLQLVLLVIFAFVPRAHLFATDTLSDLLLQAGQGDAVAQNKLGDCYYSGKGVEQSYSEAVAWYRKAAEQGNMSAQYNLGSYYEYGVGVTQSYSEAMAWYRKAAEQGWPGAQQKLALFTEDRLPSLVDRLLDGDHTLLETEFLERLLIRSLHENDAREGTSKAVTKDFWLMIYQMNPSFFIEQDEDYSRFRMERFVEVEASGNEEALAALAWICADFYAKQRKRKDGDFDGEELGQCFTVKHQGRAEPALCHFVWTYPERTQRIIDAFTSSKEWKKECLEVWKFLLMQKDLHGTPPLLLAYGHRRNVVSDGQHVDLFSSLLQTLSPQEWSLLPVTAKRGEEVPEDSSSNDKREETLARGRYGEETYLAYAIEMQDTELLKALLVSNFDPNVKIAGHKNANKETVLHRAIWMRWAEGTQLLLQHNAKNYPRGNRTTPSDLLKHCLQEKPGKWKKWDSLHPEERPLWERIGMELNSPSTP